MPDFPDAKEIFFAHADWDEASIRPILEDALHHADDGELFLESHQSEGLVFDDGRIHSASFDSGLGFGLRAVAKEAIGYGFSSSLSKEALKRAAETVKNVTAGYQGTIDLSPPQTTRQLYQPLNPLPLVPFEKKLELLSMVDSYARQKEPLVQQVSASLSGSWQCVCVMRADGTCYTDIRPLTRFNVSVVLNRHGRMETGTYGAGGRFSYDQLMEEGHWKEAVDEALRQALVNLESIPAPAGDMVVVLGPGWPGILLHEAVGHGLEGDFNRKKTSAFSGLIGERVAAPGVTVIDDGTLPDRRGSISIDDEGTPSMKTVLIEDGILKSYMFDRLNARLMGKTSTGNGRRESFAAQPLPRMTNTFMPAGDRDPEEILSSVEKGVLAVSFGGGQVDITSGKFVFSATEAYQIEKGKIGAPLKGATLIGNGPDVLKRVSMIGNDLKLDRGVGTCGKAGQSVPVGVGQPSLRIDGLTVGGTSL